MLNEQLSSQNNANALLAGVTPSFYVKGSVPVFLSNLCPKESMHLFQNVNVNGKKYKKIIIAGERHFNKKDFDWISDFSNLM